MRAATVLALLLLLAGEEARGHFDLPPLPSPDRYGTIMINRSVATHGTKPVIFPHWIHRMRFSCRVCHSELEFNMKANTTEITNAANKKRRYCGACHNGIISFRHNGYCDICHSGDIGYSDQKFGLLVMKSTLPRSEFGNLIDWQEAVRLKLVTPQNYLKERSQDMAFDRVLLLEAELNNIPPAYFPHREHAVWLDCSNCHPDIFNIKKKTTKHFLMKYILNGQFCGSCHLSVAFPMDDCARCHPKKEAPKKEG